MKDALDNFTIQPDASVRDAMSAIDANASGIVLVVDEEQRLKGTITDGDIRRAILEGSDLDTDVHEIMSRQPTTVSPDTPPGELLRLFNDLSIRHLPVVDQTNRLLGIEMLSEVTEHMEGTVKDPPRTAVVMAGGLGKRLRPLTEETPKPLIEVGGKPILERIIEHLAAGGVERVYVTTRYLADQIEEYFGDGSRWGVEIKYVREEKRLGTAGALTYVQSSVDEPILVMNGDLLTDFNVRELFRFHDEHEAAMTVGVRHYEFEVPYGVAEVDGIRISEVREKPTYDFFVNAGVYVVAPSQLERIPDDTYFDITDLIDEVLADGQPVISFPIVEKWIDIGRPEDLARANKKLGDGDSLAESDDS